MMYTLSIIVGGIAVALGIKGKFIPSAVFLLIALALLVYSRA